MVTWNKYFDFYMILHEVIGHLYVCWIICFNYEEFIYLEYPQWNWGGFIGGAISDHMGSYWGIYIEEKMT